MKIRNDIKQGDTGLSNRNRLSVQLFNLHFQVYFVVVSFLGLMYLEPVASLPVWPFYAAAGWGAVLFIQFILVFRKRKRFLKQ